MVHEHKVGRQRRHKLGRLSYVYSTQERGELTCSIDILVSCALANIPLIRF